MLGEKIGQGSGKVTNRRILPGSGAGPNMETSFAATGSLLGTELRENGTYTASMRQDGTLFGEGQGIIMSAQGDVASWKGQGVGVIKAGGVVSYRGAVFYESASPKWSRLNSVAVVFEYEIDADGNTKSQLWEWK